MTTAKWMMLGLLLGLSASTTVSCGAAKKCGPADCPFGCCDSTGTCQAGSSDGACGTTGAMCSACSLVQRCQVGACTNIAQAGGGSGGGSGGGTGGGTGGGSTGGGTGGGGGGCGANTCAGCCQNNTCIMFPNNTGNTTCGRNGLACTNCTSLGTTCNAPTFSCVGPAGGGGGGGATGGGGGSTGPCTGCLNNGSCVPYSTSSTATTTCGGSAAMCASCTMACVSGNCTAPLTGSPVGNARVRLVGGTATSGRLEVFANGGWGQVCDDSFGANNNGPTVVCRDLGFSGLASQTSDPGIGEYFLLDQVACLGTESTLLNCPHDPVGVEDCGSSEAVFITCTP